jgi:hypothetical protein
MKKFLFILVVSLTWGATYPVVEPDPIKELQEIIKEKKKEIPKLMEKAKQKLWNYRGEYLPPAMKNATYSFEPTYCLDHNIMALQNGQWIVLYPKGFCFNPLNYIKIAPPPIVVFNACRKKELQYVEKNLYPKLPPDTLWTITGCTLRDMKQIAKNSFLRNVHWYFLTKELKEKLRLRGTISIVNADLKERKIKVKVLKVAK